MKPRIAFISTFAIIALAGLLLSADRAQGESPGTPMLAGANASVGGAGGGIFIQGHLTNPGGNPLNGTFNITASIYDVPTGGVARCSDTQSVLISGGLFQMTIATCTSANINGEPLWLGLTVGADPEMTPRTAILPVPYAMSLRPGAIINGDMSVLGKIGVGTSTPSQALEVAGNALIYPASGPSVLYLRNRTTADFSNIVFVDSGGTYRGYLGYIGATYFDSSRADHIEFGSNGKAITFRPNETEVMRLTTGGNVGIGTTNPVSGTLDVRSIGNGVYGGTLFGSGVRGDSAAGIGVYARSNGTTLSSPALFAEATNTTATEPAGIAIFGLNHSGDTTLVLKNTGTGDMLRTFTSTNHINFRVTNSGRVVAPVVQITGGSDLAEKFQVDEPRSVEPGTLMVIDESRPGQLKMSEAPYDTKVAGIVSGAGGVQPGMTLQQDDTLDGNTLVAISGRVFVKAEAISSPIRPGDLLTTSSLPGHAMKATDRQLAGGAIIGKAMTGLDEGTGLVLVLVNLQ